MPAKRTAKKASPPSSPASPEASVDPAATEADPTATETASGDGVPEDDSAPGEQVPMNRAERRAKGKGGAAAQPTSRGKVIGGKGPASTQRMWANRRSG